MLPVLGYKKASQCVYQLIITNDSFYPQIMITTLHKVDVGLKMTSLDNRCIMIAAI